MLEHSVANSQQLSDHLRRQIGRPRGQSYSFERSELRRLDRCTVEHVPTGSRAVFYNYVEAPPEDYVPGASITNAGIWAEPDLIRFNVAAWKLLAEYRYGFHIRTVRRIVRTLAYKVSIAEIVRVVQCDDPTFPAQRVLACLQDMAEVGETRFVGEQGIERLPEASPITRRR